MSSNGENYNFCHYSTIMVIGVTGSIGVGKSTVASFLKKWGADIIDVDRLGWAILEQKKDELVKAFGSSIIDVDRGATSARGKIDRNKLGKLVFGNPAKMELLNSIVHPLLLEELKEQIKTFRIRLRRIGRKILVVDCALIYEWKIENWFDKIILVKAKYDIKLDRLLSMGYTQKETEYRIKSQLPDEVITSICKTAHFVVENNDDLETLRKKIKKIWDAESRLVGTQIVSGAGGGLE